MTLLKDLPKGTTHAKPLVVVSLVSLSLLIALSCTASPGAPVGVSPAVVGAAQAGSKVIADFDQPLLFAYLSWEKKVETKNGVVIIRGEGVSPKGGAGANVELDLSASASLCPVVRVKVGEKNTLKTLKMVLNDDTINAASDAEKRGATFEYPLPGKATEGFVTIYPKGGATIAKPNATGAKGTVDAAKIKQWQLQGDWGGDGSVDVEVDSVTLAEPDAAAKQAQADADKEEAARKGQEIAARAELNAKYGKRTAL
ncbi:MAG: hypothetical protein H7Y38_04295 [Armatimonadetes bacterium]|nr:hypothetical protein [Armatimonadota bacterium]